MCMRSMLEPHADNVLGFTGEVKAEASALRCSSKESQRGLALKDLEQLCRTFATDGDASVEEVALFVLSPAFPAVAQRRPVTQNAFYGFWKWRC